MSDSFNSSNCCLSPIPSTILPRKLDFSKVNDSETPPDTSPVNTAPLSPPYKRVRALRLFDSPATPKTILEKCSTPSHHGPRSRLFPPKLNAPAGQPSGSSHHLHPPSLTMTEEDSAVDSLASCTDTSMAGVEAVSSCTEEQAKRLLGGYKRPVANINPFTPDGQLLNKKKRALSKTPVRSPWGDPTATAEQPAKRLKESNISRYNVEFLELGTLGSGEFGRVTRCVNRLDGCEYALKRSLRPVAGSAGERSALNEVYAHAVLGKHPHVVRYYSAWAEDDHMIIQNEYCDGGSLQGLIAEKGHLEESELLVLMAHIADGLRYIHSMQLVHMDIKPGNVFVSRDAGGDVPVDDSADDGFDEHDDDERPNTGTAIVYKIGDLGHVTCVTSPQVEEGDCRYLPKEVLQEDFSNLTKADIFAFGLTLYEAGGGGPLPKNGPEWHAIRDGQLPDLSHCSREFNQLLKRMVDPDPTERPTAARILRNPVLHPPGNKSRAQLRRELAAARLNNELLARKLHEAATCIKSLAPSVAAAFNNNVHESTNIGKLRTRASKAKALQQRTGSSANTTAETSLAIADMLQKVAANSSGKRLTRSFKFGRTNSNVNF